MKHLLTTLIAAIFLVLPLHAVEPPKHPSIRILDHEGSPIEGLVVRLVQTSEDTDPLTYDEKPALDFARSNANGIAVFETVDVRDLQEGNRFAVGPSSAAGLVYMPSIPSDQRQEFIFRTPQSEQRALVARRCGVPPSGTHRGHRNPHRSRERPMHH